MGVDQDDQHTVLLLLNQLRNLDILYINGCIGLSTIGCEEYAKFMLYI